MNLRSLVLASVLAAAGLADTAKAAERLSLHARTQTHRFALVIGSNATLDDKAAPLKFADDDAARMAELLTEVGVDVELVATLDRDSQEQHPDLVSRSRAPTKKGVRKAWDALRGRMAKAPEGAIELIVFYSGHGDVGPDGQGFLTLQGDKLTRQDLFGDILESSPADHNHVLIDACRSESFVLSRGKAWKNDRAGASADEEVRRYLDKTQLGAFPNTGVIVAHSADQQTHEWERYRGGIFTHELLSGLRGGADQNGDGNIEYSELGAFVAAANSAVKDPRARLQVVVRPPKSDERHPVLAHESVADQRVLYWSSGDGKQYTLENERGVRVADVRYAKDQPGWLRLPDGDVFVARREAEDESDVEEAHIAAHVKGRVTASKLKFRARERAGKGALDEAFRAGLFLTPMSTGYYTGYTDQQGLLAVREPGWHVEVWEETEDGRKEKVAETDVEEGSDVVVEVEDDEKRGRAWWDSGTTWGAISLGTIVTPFNADGKIRDDPRRVTSNQFRGCIAPLQSTDEGCSAFRGFDVRWQFFRTRTGQKYPRVLGYFRTGYTAGHASFSDTDGMIAMGKATSLAYMTVPLFLGGNIYAFDNFPVRPYAGLGFGFDILRVDYDRAQMERLTDVSMRIGFELHAGIEARITNYVSLTAEVMQLWSARRKIVGLPDFTNEGFTVITGIAIGIPLHKPTPPRKTKTIIKARKIESPKPKTVAPKPEPAAPDPVAPEPGPAPAPPPAPTAPPDPAP